MKATYQTQLLSSKQTMVAAQLLAESHPVVIPTETVYGIAADARSNEACRKVFVAKQRPADNPLIVHFYSIKQIMEYDIVLTDMLNILLRKFAPGPLTVIAPTSSKIANVACAGLSTVAIRIPSHPVARAILKQCGFPLAAPSANLSGYISATTGNIAVGNLYGGRVAAIVQAGATRYGVESTIIKDDDDVLTIMRSGAIAESLLRGYIRTLSMRGRLSHYTVRTESALAGLIKELSVDTRQKRNNGAGVPLAPKTLSDDTDALLLPARKISTTQQSTRGSIKKNTAKLQLAEQLDTADIDNNWRIATDNRAEHNTSQYVSHQDVSGSLSTIVAKKDGVAVVPGSKYRHYQPRATVILFSVFQSSICVARRGVSDHPTIHHGENEQHQSTASNPSNFSAGLLITKQSLWLCSRRFTTIPCRVNIIERQRKKTYRAQCITIHIPIGWRYLNLTDIAIVPSAKRYMRHLYFFYWAFDNIGVKTIYTELPHRLDIIKSALGDRLVRSAL